MSSDSAPSSDWYCVIAGERVGPLTWEEMRALARRRGLAPGDLVWEPSFGDTWRPARQVPGLFAAIPDVPPPVLPPPLPPTAAPAAAAEPPEEPAIAMPTTPLCRIEGPVPSARAAAAAAWQRMRLLLFKPFDLAQWFSIGFCAWLASLGAISVDLSSFMEDGRRHGFTLDLVGSHLQAFMTAHPTLWAAGMAALAGVGVISVLTSLLLVWLRSRGTFMLLHRLHRPAATVSQSWIVSSDTAGSLFWWRIGFGVTAFGGAVLLAAISFLTLRVGAPSGASWSAIGAAITRPWLATWAGVGTVYLLLVTFVRMMAADFVEPVMYWRGVRALAAWRTVLDLLKQHPLAVLRYYLLMLVWLAAAGAAILAAGMLTCCVGFLVMLSPFIGAVARLPIAVFFRGLGMQVLLQWRPDLQPVGLDLVRPAVVTPPRAG